MVSLKSAAGRSTGGGCDVMVIRRRPSPETMITARIIADNSSLTDRSVFMISVTPCGVGFVLPGIWFTKGDLDYNSVILHEFV